MDSSLYSVDLEVDKLNNHESMTEICELITYMVESGISPLPDNEVDVRVVLPRNCSYDSL